MIRPLKAAIATVRGVAREGLRVDFYAAEPAVSTNAITDASGVFLVDLETDTPYLVPVMNAVTVGGQTLPAGTVLRITVPEGEEEATIADVTVEIIDWSLPTQLARIAAIEGRVAALEGA